MTEMLNKEFSRKTFVKGGGALIVGLGRAGAGARRRPATRRSPTVGRTTTSPTQHAGRLVDRDHADNTVIVTHGQPEWGHGTPTGIVMLVAEELDIGHGPDGLPARRRRG